MPDEPARESNWHKAMAGHGLSVEELIEQRRVLVEYLLSRVRASDFHAVQDAASDIREINAKLEVLRA